MNAEQEFDTELAERSGDEPSLMVDVEGFEGPLDLLLTLARQQKVDLAKISILALADQYLAFIEEVMAAWLAYLKSRLLLPEQHPAEGLSAEEMANALAQRLRRLEAIRKFAEQLMNRPQLGRDVFERGRPEPIAEIKHPQWSATLYDLLSAYASRRQIQSRSVVHVPKRTVWSLAEAREALERLVGQGMDWSPLDQYLVAYLTDPATITTVLASSFAAALEMIREGRLEAHQQGAFTPLYLRKKRNADGALSQGGAAESGNG
jgi:segregation and condensation protein A